MATKSIDVGVRDVAVSGSNEPLVQAIQESIADLLVSLKLCARDITLSCGSGMITSNVGLSEVPHVQAPAGAADLAQRVQKYALPDSDLDPILLVPGIKTAPDKAGLTALSEFDIMRGEETEVFGLLCQQDLPLPTLILLPGSHTKLVFVNEQRQIESSFTSMAGEMLQLLATRSVLASSVTWPPPEPPDWKMINNGIHLAKEHHMIRASFMVRMADAMAGCSTEACSWLLIGIVAGSDVQAIKRWTNWKPTLPLVISAREPLVDIYRQSFEALGCECTTIPQEQRERAAAFGAIHICESYERRE